MPSAAVVLGGGGVAGIAWETGVLKGLCERGVPLAEAGLILGTSAGSFAGTYLGVGALEEQFDAQLAAATAEIPAPMSEEWLNAVAATVAEAGDDSGAACRALGQLALAADTPSTAERMSVVRSRLGVEDWPQAPLKVTAIDADTGERHLLDASSGIGFADAVAASGAVPGIWPTVYAGGRRWIDGACISANNADLAGGHDAVLVVGLSTGGMLAGAGSALDREVAALRSGGAQVHVILPDEASAQALGANHFDPSVRPAAARAGRQQAWNAAGSLRKMWSA